LKLVAEAAGELPDDDVRLLELDVDVVAVVVGLVAEAELVLKKVVRCKVRQHEIRTKR
jgi:hypothetical protein